MLDYFSKTEFEFVKIINIVITKAWGEIVIFEYYNHLGARSYYCLNSNSSICWHHIGEALAATKLEKREIDTIAILELFMKNYALFNRTIVKKISRSPWMARPGNDGGWQFADLPLHGNLKLPFEIIALKLKELLYREAIEFLNGKNTIGILLSGGMDSRVVAGLVRKAQVAGDFSGQIVALTWGCPETRDLIYARQIAKKYRWEHIHFPLSSEILQENIKLAAIRGAEYSPIHLHAMKAVSETKGLNGVLAGSYGDSIGRGEYSGTSVDNLYYILYKHHNHFSFLYKKVEQDVFLSVKKDVENARNLFQGRTEIACREIDLQIHYLHRQLNPCMSVIDDLIPLYQMFGKPDVFGFMWQLDNSCRKNEVYYHLLNNLPGRLLEIPWARTGNYYYHRSKNQQDSYSSLNNKYGKWLRNDCRSYIVEQIGNGALQSLGIFSDKALKMWVNHWPKSKIDRANRLDEQMAWLATLAYFVKHYDIMGSSEPIVDSYTEIISLGKGLIYNLLYQTAVKFMEK